MHDVAVELARQLDSAINDTWDGKIDATVHRIATQLIQEIKRLHNAE